MLRSRAVMTAVFLLAVATVTHVYAQTSPDPSSTVTSSAASLTNRDVLNLVKAKLPANVIIVKIQKSACHFDTSPAALAKLKTAGVPDNVILAMVKAPVAKAPATKPLVAMPSERAADPAPVSAHEGRTLWIARFTGQTKALAAIASVQQGDLAALQQSVLFSKVSSFSAEAKPPAGAWTLSGKEINYAGGSAVKRVMLGFGTGRAHIVMEYKLRDPKSKVVWTEKIKTEPSFWGSAGAIGGVQNQRAALGKQPQKLLDGLAKFFQSE